MKRETFYVGMDLGTFQTSILASNAKRGSFHTAVGWPRDHVARAMLGRDVIFGEDVVQQRLALDVVRPFAKGALKFVATEHDAEQLERHKHAARLLVEHAVSLVAPPTGAAIYGVIGAPSLATSENKHVLIEAARESLDAVVLAAEPFTVAYGMDQLTDIVVVDIGAGTIDICPLYGAYPKDEEQVTIPLGGDTVDEHFLQLLHQQFPEAQVTLNMAREIKEKFGFVHDVNESAVIHLPVDGRPQPFDVTEPLKEACGRLVDPIIDGLREVIAKFDPEFQQKILKTVLLAGGGSQLKGLDQLVAKGLEPFGTSSVQRVYDCRFAGASGALKLAMNMPDTYWEELAISGELQREAA
jgi:rod shape-determining protein MreB